jgi:Fe-S cluster biogenesis protein NfuA
MIEKVGRIIERLRPSFQEDGHDIEIVEITPDNIVKVKLCGHCNGGCTGSKIILGRVIELALKQKIPEVKRVEVVSRAECAEQT